MDRMRSKKYTANIKGRLRSTLFVLLLLHFNVTSAGAINFLFAKHLFDITGQFNNPSEVAVSASDFIYVVDGVNNAIKIFKYNGEFHGSFGREGTGASEFNQPLGIDIDTEGKIYIADSGNHRVQIFSPKGEFINECKITPAGGRAGDPTDMVADSSAKRLYVVNNDHHQILVFYLLSLRLVDTFGKPGTGNREFRYPFLITQDKEGLLYISDVINTRVQVLNSKGLFVENIGDWGVEKGQFFRPKGVALDKSGRVFVSDSYMGVIQVFGHNGEFLAAIGDPDTKKIKRFKSPVGLWIDRQNRLYVVEMFANRVGVYSIGGKE